MSKVFYLDEIKKIVPKILAAQDEKGSFYSELGKTTNIPNARWQEAILTLAWYQERFRKDFQERIEKGLKYWCGLQNKNGSFPELKQESFAATAFSSLTTTQTLSLLENKLPAKLFERTIDCLEKSRNYLIEHSQEKRTNQEAVAAAALNEMKRLSKVDSAEIDKKVESVLKNKTRSGFFLEDQGVDLGYASLTCEMLCLLGLEEECQEFIESLSYLIFPDGTLAANLSRTKGWLILDCLERLGQSMPAAKKIASLHIKAHEKGVCNSTHLISLRHIMTDAYRLCWAFDNCREEKPKAKLPVEELDWKKKFPEKLLVVRKPEYMALFNLSNHFTQSIWFENSLFFNLTDNLKGNTVLEGDFVAEDLEKISFNFDDENLEIKGVCRENFSHRHILKKIIGKSKIAFSGRKQFTKKFTFMPSEIKVSLEASQGIEQVPVLGNFELGQGFAKRKEEILGQSIFNGRGDFFIYQQKFKNSLAYRLKG